MATVFYYDYTCPFCCVASRRLQRLPDELDLKIDWKGIEIHPGLSSEGRKIKKTIKTEQLAQYLCEVAMEDGVKINLPGFITNSTLCLEASEYAESKGSFIQFHNKAYDYYFMKGENIGQLDVVLEIGEKVNLNTEELEEKLRSGAMRDRVDSNKRSAAENMVTGVPTVYFNGFRVHGAQSTETYEAIIKKHLKV